MPVPLQQAHRVAFALGSGGARGLAHIGVLRAFAACGIRPAAFAGSSMGAIVGAFAAAGRLDDLERFVLGFRWLSLARYGDFAIARGGVIQGQTFQREIARLLEVVSFGDLALPFRAVATDLLTGEPVVMGDGDLVLALRASASIPGLFVPAPRLGRWLVDGALSDPVPVSAARALGADFVVAVDVTPAPAANLPPRPDAPSFPDIMAQTVRIAESRIAAESLRATPPDLLVRPDVGACGTLAFDKAAAIIRAGADAARRALAAAGFPVSTD